MNNEQMNESCVFFQFLFEKRLFLLFRTRKKNKTHRNIITIDRYFGKKLWNMKKKKHKNTKTK